MQVGAFSALQGARNTHILVVSWWIDWSWRRPDQHGQSHLPCRSASSHTHPVLPTGKPNERHPGAFPLLMPNDRVFSFLFSPSLAKAQTVLLISCGLQSLALSFIASATAASRRPEGSSSRVAIAHRLLARCCLLNLMASSGMPSLAVTSTSTACISACTAAAAAATHCCDRPLGTAKAQHLCMLCIERCLLRLTASLGSPKLG